MIVLAIARWFGKGDSPPTDTSLPDEELIQRYARGDARAFEILFARHERPVYHYILRSVRRAERAEELTQDVFVRVIRNASRYQPDAKFTTWLWTIVRNLCVDDARRRSHRNELSLDTPLDADDPGATWVDRTADPAARSGTGEAARRQLAERLDAALARLPDEQREVFLLRQIEGLRFREIAEMTGIPENTVKSRMRYALDALRPCLAEFQGGAFDDETGGDDPVLARTRG